MSDDQTPDETVAAGAEAEAPEAAAREADESTGPAPEAATADAPTDEAPPARSPRGRRGKGRAAAAPTVAESEGSTPDVEPAQQPEADTDADADTNADGEGAGADDEGSPDAPAIADPTADLVESEDAADVVALVHDLQASELFHPDEVADAPRAPHPLKPVVEALIFASPEPLTVKAMTRLIEEHTKEDIEAALAEVRESYARSDGLQLVEVAGGFQIVTRPELYEWVRRLFKERTTSKLSVQALETLAVIAYKQPVTSGEIAEIRGVSATTGVLNTLLDRKLVKIVGRKQVVGRPFMYGTTREFLDKFGLRDLSDLPKVEDMSEALGFDLPSPVDEGDGVSLPFDDAGPDESQWLEGAAGHAAAPAPEPDDDGGAGAGDAEAPGDTADVAEVAETPDAADADDTADTDDATDRADTAADAGETTDDASADRDTSDDER